MLNSEPTTQLPGMVRATKDGPAPHLSGPRRSSVLVGIRSTGPAPQIHLPESLGEKKCGKCRVANAVIPIGAGCGCRLGDKGDDGPGDQVPFVIQSKGQDRLDVEDVLGLILRPEIEIGVVLKRQAYHAGNGILGRPGQFFLSVLAGFNDAVAICFDIGGAAGLFSLDTGR